MNPKLRIIGRPQIDVSAIRDFLFERQLTWNQTEGALPAEELVEFSGRVCYMSFSNRQSPRRNGEYIFNLIDQGHESVLEHATWTFVLSSVSRAFSHQFVRHRIGFSYSQLSQQYVAHDDIKPVQPVDFSQFPRAESYWREATEKIREAYRGLTELLNAEVSKSDFSSRKERTRFVRSVARSVLPNAMETVIVFSANARSLRHFLNTRGSIEGDLEMRAVSAKVFEVLQKEAPSLFHDFRLESMPDGSPIVRRVTSSG